MNDPVLNRKLFRHQAQIIHNKIPKYKLGGGPTGPFTPQGYRIPASVFTPQGFGQATRNLAMTIVGPGKFVKGAKYAYGTYKAARAATKAKPAHLRGTWKSMLPFTKSTGAKSAWQTLKHKFPKSTAGASIATGGLFAKMGYDDVREGLKKKDYGQVAMGIGYGLPSVGGIARGIQALRIPTVSAKASKVSKALTGSRLKSSWKDPRTYGYLGLLGGGALASVMKDEAEAAETLPQELIEILTKVAKDIENITEEEFNKAVEIYEKTKSSPEKSPGHPSNIGKEEMLTDEIVPDAGGSTSGESSEILAKQKEMNAETQANVLKNKFDNADMATQREFLKFRQSITDLTGTYGNDRDLILMKLASGMMTGKTGQTGLKGFMDVTGKAMGPTVDTALALSNAQKGRDTDLATAFLKMKAEQAEADADAGGMSLKGTQERFIVKDPSSPYGYKVVFGQYNKDTGQIMEHLGNQQYQVMQGEPVNIKVSQAQLQKSRIRVSSSAQAHEMAAWVEKYMQDNLKGVTGNVKLKLADLFAFSDSITQGSNKYTQGLDNATFMNSEIFSNENIYSQDAGDDDMVWTVKGRVKEGDLIKQQYYKEQREIQENMAEHVNKEGWDVSDSELAQLTKAALIENRLKYLVANANKQADRLTRYDINNAEKSTAILPFINLALWDFQSRYPTRWKKIMAKVTVTFQEPTDEYEASNQRMMKFKFEQLKTELNTSYQRTIENDTQAFQWFNMSYG